MYWQAFTHFCIFALVTVASGSSNAAIVGGLVNKDVQRTVDLSSSLAAITSVVTLENSGKTSSDYFIFTVEANQLDRLASVVASVKSKDGENELVVAPANVDGAEPGVGYFKVQLSASLAAGKAVAVTVSTKFTHSILPFPSEIRQAERQLVKYFGNLYYFSPYQTLSQKTIVNLASGTVESYTKTKPVSKSDRAITYGPFENQDPMKEAELMVHYENLMPFLAVTTMTRVIEVSHWGNIAVEETYNLRHTGAKLKGSFSRYDYQRQPSPLSSVKSFKTVLPASAADVYYRDEIGNISTSNMKEMDDAVEIEIRPRFPLFGGWKTHYMVGYNVPSYQYLWTDGGNGYSLKMPFVDHVFDNQVVDEILVKIILPEGSDVSDLKVPYEFTRGSDEVKATYLDTTGRPVVVLSKKNLVDDHIKEFELRYSFNQVMMFREPFLIVGFLYFIFLFVIIYVRLDFSIARDEAAEARLKVASYVESAQELVDKRSASYQAYDDAINKYKANKDMSAYQTQKKKIDSQHKELSNELASLQAKLRADGGDVIADKITEIQKLDAAYKDSVAVSASNAEKLVAGKLNKDPYLSQEETASNKRSDILSKMESLASQL